MMNTVVANKPQIDVNVIITEEEVSALLSGLVLSLVSFVPSAFVGAWVAHSQLISQIDSLRAPAASAGCLLSLLFIPFMFHLANKNSIGRLLVGVVLCAFTIGACIGLQ